jgi:DNA-binding response OmpR family regulator
VSTDTTAARRYAQLLRRFTRRVSVVSLADAVRTIAFQTVNIVILDAGERTNELLAVLERFVAQGKKMSALAIISPRLLGRVRVPTRLVADFVVEGASEAEITARLRFLMTSRETDETEEVVQDGDLTLDLAQHKIYVSGAALPFAHIEYSLLSFFITHPNRTYSRNDLLQRVWGNESNDTPSRTVDVHVRRVRAKLYEYGIDRLETIRGVGYLWRSQ